MKQMDIAEFRDVGFLQEVNRLFFHPMGLALFVTVNDDGTVQLGGILDERDDPEGWIFGEGPDKKKAETACVTRDHVRVTFSSYVSTANVKLRRRRNGANPKNAPGNFHRKKAFNVRKNTQTSHNGSPFFRLRLALIALPSVFITLKQKEPKTR